MQRINFTITPADVVSYAGWQVNSTQRNKIVLRFCPSCFGGANKDINTFFLTQISIRLTTVLINAQELNAKLAVTFGS